MCRRGFSLVELSVVLIVLGLLVGGVLAGQSLIKSASIRKVAGEYQQYATAYTTFQVKYDCVVGDCARAVEIFGGPCSTKTTGNATCNGNGDGDIVPYETRYVCQQFNLAQIIPGSCYGGYGSGPDGVQSGVNALPTSFNKNDLMELGYYDSTAWTYTTHFVAGNYLSIQGNSPAGTYYPRNWAENIAMNIADAEALDRKIDDGKPLTGRLVQPAFLCGDTGTNTYTGTPPDYGFCMSFYRITQ